MTVTELSLHAADLERARRYEEASQLWDEAEKIENEKQKPWASIRAKLCLIKIKREWA